MATLRKEVKKGRSCLFLPDQIHPQTTKLIEECTYEFIHEFRFVLFRKRFVESKKNAIDDNGCKNEVVEWLSTS